MYYGEVQSQTTFGTKPTDNYIIINGHKFVDLGLPSGLLWAACNVGAATAADDGDYYAWGETATKTDYYCSTYTWTSDGGSTFTKYTTDGKTVLDKEDDAAYVNWGSSCRMPTIDEFTELRNSDNCTWTWTSQTTSSGSSIYGYKVSSVKNGNSIFLPASGCRNNGGLNNHGSIGSGPVRSTPASATARTTSASTVATSLYAFITQSVMVRCVLSKLMPIFTSRLPEVW